MQDLKDLLIMSCVNGVIMNVTGFPNSDLTTLNIISGSALLIMVALVVKHLLVALRGNIAVFDPKGADGE